MTTTESTALSLEERHAYASFNQDNTQFIQATSSGFCVWSVDPVAKICQRKIWGGLAIAEMLYCTNVFALVGTGTNDEFPKSKVILWSDETGRPAGELPFNSDVCAVKLTSDYIIVALPKLVFLYDYEFDQKGSIATRREASGIIALSHCATNRFLAIPGIEKGHLVTSRLAETHRQILDQRRNSGSGEETQLTDHREAKRDPIINSGNIAAHNGEVAAVCLSIDGSLLATASDKGTLLRIWDTETDKQHHELRRGTTQCTIYSMAFSPCRTYLAAYGSHGTVHLFQVPSLNKGEDDVESTTNRKSGFSSLGWLLGGIVASEWSSCWFHLPPHCIPPGGCVPRGMLCFCAGKNGRPEDLALSLVIDTGEVFKLKFDPKKGGEMFAVNPAGSQD